MPSPNRFVLPGEGLIAEFRRRPMALALVAAAGGLVCGALVVGALTAPSKPAEPKIAAALPAATTPAKAADAAPIQVKAEEQKPDANQTADNNCAKQTWPYIARSCLTEAKPETKPETRGVRVVSTDKLAEPTIGAIEKPAAPKPAEPVVARAPAATNAAPAENAPEVVEAVKALDYSKMHPVAAAQPEAAPQPQAAPQAVATTTPAPEAAPAAEPPKARVAEKPRHKRVAKSAPRKPIELKPDAETVASGSNDDDAGEHVVQSRDSSGRHVVQRWIERDYRGDDGRPQRVIVPQRRANTGIFGGLFGGGYASGGGDDY